MSDTPRTDEAADYTAPEKLHSLCKDLERELAVEEVEKTKYRERAWRAELKLDERWGLRKEITAALGITDETGDDALRKGLETIKALKAEREALLDGLRAIKKACHEGSLLTVASIGSELEKKVRL